MIGDPEHCRGVAEKLLSDEVIATLRPRIHEDGLIEGGSDTRKDGMALGC